MPLDKKLFQVKESNLIKPTSVKNVPKVKKRSAFLTWPLQKQQH